MKIISNRKGIALIAVYIMIAVLLVFAGAYFWRSFNEFRFAERQRDETKAYYIAQAGINEVVIGIYQAFRNSADWQNNRNIIAFQSWFANRATLLNNYTFPANVALDGGRYSVILPSQTARSPIMHTSEGILLKLIGIGEVFSRGGTIRKVVAVTISYDMEPSPIFNYAYFINNFGWMWGGGITINGDVRSNGNFSFRGNPTINGDIYAATNPDLGAAGIITGNNMNWDIPQYYRHVSDRARPTDPTDPADAQGTVYEGGYNGTSNRYEHQEVLDMPRLGSLTTYRQLAISENGQVTQGGVVLVDNVYNGDGPDGIAGTPDDGCMVLTGTAANPVVINGPVVVDGDVIIKGVVSGQGTIYSGRNVHIIGDITYDAPPSWPKPDPTPDTTAQVNTTKDFIGLASKGNVIIGDYTRNDWQRTLARYLSPPFTQGYEVDASDAPLGYDSDGNPGNGYWFNGNYTAFDGDFTDPNYSGKDNGAGGSEQRRFFESSLSDSYIHSIAAPSNQIRNVDGAIYNNHAFSGRVGCFTINGTIVSRDEAIVYSGSITMNYDVRAFGTGIENIDIYLPHDLTLPETRTTQSG